MRLQREFLGALGYLPDLAGPEWVRVIVPEPSIAISRWRCRVSS